MVDNSGGDKNTSNGGILNRGVSIKLVPMTFDLILAFLHMIIDVGRPVGRRRLPAVVA